MCLLCLDGSPVSGDTRGTREQTWKVSLCEACCAEPCFCLCTVFPATAPCTGPMGLKSATECATFYTCAGAGAPVPGTLRGGGSAGPEGREGDSTEDVAAEAAWPH